MANDNEKTMHTPQQTGPSVPGPDAQVVEDLDSSNAFLDQLAGRNADETAYIDASQVDSLEGVTPTDQYQGITDSNQELVERGAERFDLLLEQELRDGETDDPMEAVQEGLTYVPPIDPPIVPDPNSYESVQVASGFALSRDEYDSPPDIEQGSQDRFLEPGDDMTAMVRMALRADAATTHLADQLVLATINGTVFIRGVVDDLDDTDNIVAVISDLPGVEKVVDQTTVRGL